MFRLWRNKKKKEADKSQEVERRVMRNTLTLTLVDGKKHEWTHEDWKGKNRIVPWIKFYRWYFEKGSECYIMRYDIGETMFKRADIRTFTVQTTQVKN